MDGENRKPPPPQFSLRAIFGLTAALALLFGTLSWLDVPVRGKAIVLVILTVGAVAAVGLVVVIARFWDDRPDDRPPTE